MTLPNFLVIGAYKSGTTSLHRYLRQHPDVYMPARKEPNFFAHELKKEVMTTEGQQTSLVDTIQAYEALFDDVQGEHAIGEASPIYLDSAAAAQRIADMLPDVKLIAILRQPVEAIYSDHNMRIRDNRNLDGEFCGRVEALGKRIESGEVVGPLYYAQLQEYAARFSPSQLKVCLYEDLRNSEVELSQALFEFLGVDSQFTPNTTRQANAGGIPRSRRLQKRISGLQAGATAQNSSLARLALARIGKLNTIPFEPLDPALRKNLSRYFTNDIKGLESFLDRDLSHWLA